jgi:hypothetical protein
VTASDKIATAIVGAGALIALAVFSRPVPFVTGRYAFHVSGDWIQRLDTATGEVLACTSRRCIAAGEDGSREAYPANESFDESMSRMERGLDREVPPQDDPLHRQ